MAAKRNEVLRKEIAKRIQALGGSSSFAITQVAEDLNIKAWQVRYYLRALRHKAPLAPTEESLKLVGHLDFGSPQDLKVFGFTLEDVSLARADLRSAYRLTLERPNVLRHKDTGKRCTLSLSEQLSILRDPKRFINLNAKKIAKRWDHA